GVWWGRTDYRLLIRQPPGADAIQLKRGQIARLRLDDGQLLGALILPVDLLCEPEILARQHRGAERLAQLEQLLPDRVADEKLRGLDGRLRLRDPELTLLPALERLRHLHGVGRLGARVGVGGEEARRGLIGCNRELLGSELKRRIRLVTG